MLWILSQAWKNRLIKWFLKTRSYKDVLKHKPVKPDIAYNRTSEYSDIWKARYS